MIVFVHQGPDAGLIASFLKSVVGIPHVTKHCDTCRTGLDVAAWFVFGSMMGPGAFRPDYANAEFVVFMIVATPWTKAFSEGRKCGLRLVVFDVRESRLTSLADRYYIIPPGTDLAVVLAILHVLLRDRLYDEDYLRKYTNAAMLVYADTYEPVGLRDHPTWKGRKTYAVYDEATGAVRWKVEAERPALMWEGNFNGRPVKTALALIWDAVKGYTPE